MNLKNGEFYLNASGEIIKIVDIKIKDLNRTFYDSNSNSYSENGKFYPDNKLESSIDLIAHIPKELHKMICELVNNYHTNNEVKVSAYFNSLWQHHSNTYKDEI